MKTKLLTCFGASIAGSVLLVGCGSMSACTPKEQEFYDLVSALMRCAAADPELTEFLVSFGVAPDASSVLPCGEAVADLRRNYEALQQFPGAVQYPSYESYLDAQIALGRQAYEMLCQPAEPSWGNLWSIGP